MSKLALFGNQNGCSSSSSSSINGTYPWLILLFSETQK
jgi:hypothetical protein